MNGPQHYREAERLLAQVADVVSLNYSTQTGETKADVLAAAQAHATLALAAATVDAQRGGMDTWDNCPHPRRAR